MKNRNLLMVTCAAGLTAAAAAWSAAPAATDGEDVSAAMDGEWIHISGDVTFSSEEHLGVDYGEGVILVEMDGYDAFSEAGYVDEGDKVTVRGRIDDGFAEAKSIEADTVFVHDRGVLYSTSPYDDEGDFAIVSYGYVYPLAPEDGANVSVVGMIEGVEGDDFVLDTGVWELKVSTAALEPDPFTGSARPLHAPERMALEAGDRVRVTGEIDANLFERDELEADSIVMLRQAESSAS